MSSTRPSLPARRTVVVATGNRGKLRELSALLSHLPIDLVSSAEAAGRVVEVIEDGDTFEANAQKKAREVAAITAMPTLADDSGLEVDALAGRPGVRSARYARQGATDAENNTKLLGELETLGAVTARSARFRCVIAFVDPTDPAASIEASGACEGAIASSPRGHAGFGYDPIFLVAATSFERTMAELSDDEKSRLSHRAMAIAALDPALRRWLAR